MPRAFFLTTCLLATACGPAANREGDDADGSSAGTAAPHVVEIRQIDYAYAMPARIPSGWITFRAPNAGKEHHVAVILRLPAGLTPREWHDGLAAFAATGTPPSWWADMGDAGGTGAVGAGLTAETTLWMERGTYGVLCGVIAPDGTSHWALGMQTTFEVTDERSLAAEPSASVRLILSDEGFQQEGEVMAGTQTIAVHFAEQGERTHDVHVARLGPGQTLQMAVDLMARPIEPFPLTFIGGAEQGPEGRTDYFTATFEPGRYAWVCHLHAATGMAMEFTVR